MILLPLYKNLLFVTGMEGIEFRRNETRTTFLLVRKFSHPVNHTSGWIAERELEKNETEWTGKADIWTRTKTKDQMWKLATVTSKPGPWWVVSCEWSTTDRSLTLIRPHLTHWTPDGRAGHHYWWRPSVIAHWQMSPAQIFFNPFYFHVYNT